MTHAYDRCTLGLLAQRGNRIQCRPTVYRLVVFGLLWLTDYSNSNDCSFAGAEYGVLSLEYDTG